MAPDDNNPETANKPNGGKPSEEAKPNRNKMYYRKARRKARRLGLAADNDQEAAALLEARGIDILNDNVSLLDAHDAPAAQAEGGGGAISINEAERLAEIHEIQRGLVRRRRFRLFLMVLRLLVFVALPTSLVGYYYYNIATDMYETKAEFIIQKNEAQGSAGLGGLLAGTGFAKSEDSIVVQGYLTSREALVRLDQEEGYRLHFEDENIDEYQRLPANASVEETFKFYEKNVVVGYDPSEGVIRLEVIATTPEASQRFAEALIRYAEERVDALSQRVREDQMRGTREAYDEAETRMLEAQQIVLTLQEQRGIFSADVEVASQMSIISALETQIEDKRLALNVQLSNERPNPIRVSALENEIDLLETRVAELRSTITESTDSVASLASISAELHIAEANLLTRQAMLQQALQQVEFARIEANRQVRYLSMGVEPVSPDIPTYPRKFENTLLAFIVFMGIYIMLSLTISILREQVSV